MELEFQKIGENFEVLPAWESWDYNDAETVQQLEEFSLDDGASKGFCMPRPKCELQISMLFSLQLIAFVTPSGFPIFLHWPYQWKLNRLETVPDTEFTERPCLCNGLRFWEEYFYFQYSCNLFQILTVKPSFIIIPNEHCRRQILGKAPHS